MSVGVAAVVLAHGDPAHLHRLLRALRPMPVFLHIDAKTPASTRAEMLRGVVGDVALVPPRDTRISSWSLVLAELAGLSMAIERADVEHVAVLSGADYPLVSVPALAEELQGWRGVSRLRVKPIPYPSWSTPRNDDGGMWRFRNRFLVRHDQLLSARGIPLRWPWPRRVPDGLVLKSSAQWKVIQRDHVRLVLEILDRRRDLYDFWRTTLIPEESCIASLLGSPALVGEVAYADELPSLVCWPPGGADHPLWLGLDHWDRIRAAASAPVLSPDVVGQAERGGDVSEHTRKVFARKFRSAEHEVLDRLDDLAGRALTRG